MLFWSLECYRGSRAGILKARTPFRSLECYRETPGNNLKELAACLTGPGRRSLFVVRGSLLAEIKRSIRSSLCSPCLCRHKKPARCLPGQAGRLRYDQLKNEQVIEYLLV